MGDWVYVGLRLFDWGHILREMELCDEEGEPLEGVRAGGQIVEVKPNHYVVNCTSIEERVTMLKTKVMPYEEPPKLYTVVGTRVKELCGLCLGTTDIPNGYYTSFLAAQATLPPGVAAANAASDAAAAAEVRQRPAPNTNTPQIQPRKRRRQSAGRSSTPTPSRTRAQAHKLVLS